MRIFILIVLCVFSFPSFAQEPAPVVVELFSSQGCPACPPADAYVGQLARQRDVIALSCHVDYFPVLGGLGKKFCTDRQAKYIAQIGRKKYFTPQMMVNGRMSAVGYEEQDIANKISKARGDQAARVAIQSRGQGVYNFSLPVKRLSASADMWMAIYDRPRHFKKRNGKTSTYYNVVSHMIPLGAWSGSAINRAVYPITGEKTAGFAIIAQDRHSGRIVAAGQHMF